jgi:hypothetical protein
MPEMKMKLLRMDLWTKTSAAQDGIVLLKTIRNICHKKDGSADTTIILDLVQMDKDMFLVHQAPTKPLLSYLSVQRHCRCGQIIGWLPMVSPSCYKNCI